MDDRKQHLINYYSDRTVEHGWRLSGPGPRRFGWWAVCAAGGAIYLGRTLDAAFRDVEEQRQRQIAPWCVGL